MPSLFHKSECPSTQDELQNVLLQKKLKSAGIYTFRQTKGKGQYGNSWESSEDLNIAYSFAVPADQIYFSEELFNFYTANLMREFVAKLAKTATFIKWPNDLIIQNKKICGILCEKVPVNNIQTFILGIGLNVLQQNFGNLPKAGSLLTQTGKNFDLQEITEQIHEYIAENISQKKSDSEILKVYNENLYRKEQISVFQINGLRQNGIIRSCDLDGHLLIELEKDGLQKFYYKEIEMLY